MSYLAYHFTVNPPDPGSEITAALIADFGFESFDYQEKGFTAYGKESEILPFNLEDFPLENIEVSFVVEKIAHTNWNAEWEKNFEPIVIDDLLCIRAPFHAKNKTVLHEIIIMPKMSFGTGHHQTTRLMCRKMFEVFVLTSSAAQDNRVLDMGCGTGILSILAKKLNATTVLGIDIDEWSVTNGIENCATNNCSDIRIELGDIDLLERENNFDTILANINKNILKKHLPTYSKKLNSKGKLLISGFFKTDAEELIQIAEQFELAFLKMESEEEWALLVFDKI
jgi:ribosomal protein L11 methyltransferase